MKKNEKVYYYFKKLQYESLNKTNEAVFFHPDGRSGMTKFRKISYKGSMNILWGVRD